MRDLSQGRQRPNKFNESSHSCFTCVIRSDGYPGATTGTPGPDLGPENTSRRKRNSSRFARERPSWVPDNGGPRPPKTRQRKSVTQCKSGRRPAGRRPAELRPAGLRPAGLRPAGLRPASLRPACLRTQKGTPTPNPNPTENPKLGGSGTVHGPRGARIRTRLAAQCRLREKSAPQTNSSPISCPSENSSLWGWGFLGEVSERTAKPEHR